MIVMCAGMSRSGSTLQYQLISSLVEWSNRGEGCGVWNEGKKIRTGRNKIYIYKSEMPISEKHMKNVKHSFSIIRNPFDAVVSIYRFRLAKEYHLCNGNSFSMNEIIRGEMFNVIGWVEEWERRGSHIIRYEDVFWNNGAIVRQAADILELDIGIYAISEIVKLHSIETNMRKIGYLEQWFDYTGSMLTLAHIGPNKGEPGQGDLLLDKEQKEMIMTYAGDFMERHGYV